MKQKIMGLIQENEGLKLDENILSFFPKSSVNASSNSLSEISEYPDHFRYSLIS